MANFRCAQAPIRATRRAGIPALLLAWTLLAAACGGSPPTGSSPTGSPTSPSVSAAPTVQVKIDGQAYDIAPGSTVGAAIQQFGLKLTNGHLLDVQGAILEPSIYPSKIKVNGKNGTRLTVLQAEAVVELINGRSRTEDVTVERERVDGERPLNPQTLLGTAPGELVTTTGKTSGKVESVVFHPTHRPKPPNTVALTFDDGPGRYTRKILKILKKEKVPATFFVVGYLVERSPKSIQEIVRQGHTIGNHSWSHPLSPAFAQFEQRQMENQIVRTNDALAAIDIEPSVFRPPGGSYDADVVETARLNGMRTVNWSISPDDWRSSATPKGIVKAIINGLEPGAIILLHDGGGDQSVTVKALPALIKAIRERGYGFQSLT